MNSDSSSSNSQQSHQTQSVDFSYIDQSQSHNLTSQLPSSSSVTPDRQSSSFGRHPSNGKKKKTKKKTVRKNKIQRKDKQKTNHRNKFVMSPLQANYVNRVGCPKQHSLQDFFYRRDSESPSKTKVLIKPSKEILQSSSTKYSIQDFRQGKFKLSEGYHFIESFINEMLQDKEVPQFFKKNIEDITKFDSAKKYYFGYKNIIANPLNLSLLLTMSQDGRIRNYIEFKMKFEEMILNSQLYHFLKGNLRMMNCGKYLKKKFYVMFSKVINPEGNLDEQDMIKVLQRKKPKRIDEKMQNSQEKPIVLMDLNDQYNKYRISVLNDYLRKICLKHQQKVQVIGVKIQYIMNPYQGSKVEMIKCDKKKQGSKEKKGLTKRNTQLTVAQSTSKSPQSSNADTFSESQRIYYRLVPQRIEVDLFQQLKSFVSRQVQERKEFFNFGDQMRNEPQRMMYPREDSEDFDLSDESDDF